MVSTLSSRARLNIYLADEDMKRQIKIAAAKRDLSITEYCAKAIEYQLISDGERTNNGMQKVKVPKEKLELLARMDKRRKRIGPIGINVTQLIKEGRRR